MQVKRQDVNVCASPSLAWLLDEPSGTMLAVGSPLLACLEQATSCARDAAVVDSAPGKVGVRCSI